MAILIEEEKRQVNWILIFTVIVVVGALFGGAYYLFFKTPEKIDVLLPGPIVDISKISSSTKNFDPRSVLDPSSNERDAKVFSILKNYASELTLPVPGKNNPFTP